MLSEVITAKRSGRRTEGLCSIDWDLRCRRIVGVTALRKRSGRAQGSRVAVVVQGFDFGWCDVWLMGRFLGHGSLPRIVH